jgi:hypothetical protein
VLPEGGRGTVVHVYRDGEHYEVEFAQPFPCTITLRVRELKIRPGTDPEPRCARASRGSIWTKCGPMSVSASRKGQSS